CVLPRIIISQTGRSPTKGPGHRGAFPSSHLILFFASDDPEQAMMQRNLHDFDRLNIGQTPGPDAAAPTELCRGFHTIADSPTARPQRPETNVSLFQLRRSVASENSLSIIIKRPAV
ncbi:hypothetical protein BD311DRAFT_770104, partial [Dichomitus squalens]